MPSLVVGCDDAHNVACLTAWHLVAAPVLWVLLGCYGFGSVGFRVLGGRVGGSRLLGFISEASCTRPFKPCIHL